jgi:broad specificity phosphatase PhoE
MRHGVTEWNQQRRIQGRQDVPLSIAGRQQVEQCVQEMQKSGLHVDVVVSSPLLRAFASAKVIADWYHVPLCLNPDFVERGFGEIEGLSKAEWMNITAGQNPEMVDGQHLGMETFAQLHERLMLGVARLRTRYSHEQVLIVTHGSVIHYLGRWFDEPLGIVENAKIIEFKGEKAHAYLY